MAHHMAVHNDSWMFIAVSSTAPRGENYYSQLTAHKNEDMTIVKDSMREIWIPELSFVYLPC
jgi:hypothetical protein